MSGVGQGFSPETLERERQAELEFWRVRSLQLSQAVTSLSEQVKALSERLAELDLVRDDDVVDAVPVQCGDLATLPH